jgi:hypothetical protein
MPRGAAEIDLPLRQKGGATNNIIGSQEFPNTSYTTERTVAGITMMSLL